LDGVERKNRSKARLNKSLSVREKCSKILLNSQANSKKEQSIENEQQIAKIGKKGKISNPIKISNSQKI
jgi:hypothetical protein